MIHELKDNSVTEVLVFWVGKESSYLASRPFLEIWTRGEIILYMVYLHI